MVNKISTIAKNILNYFKNEIIYRNKSIIKMEQTGQNKLPTPPGFDSSDTNDASIDTNNSDGSGLSDDDFNRQVADKLTVMEQSFVTTNNQTSDQATVQQVTAEPVSIGNELKVLDYGFVKLLETFGDELTIVNAARVSFGVQKTELSPGDTRLIKYLYKHKHYSPFRHLMFRFHIKAPEVVMRQLYKHVVGIEATSSDAVKDHAWNEISGRYKPVQEYYYPLVWRKQSADSKQASDGVVSTEMNELLQEKFKNHMQETITLYEELLDRGVAREQARLVLPMNQYTEVIWTCSAQALLNFIWLRDEETAQVEIQQYAKAMRLMVREKFPTLHGIWFEE